MHDNANCLASIAAYQDISDGYLVPSSRVLSQQGRVKGGEVHLGEVAHVAAAAVAAAAARLGSYDGYPAQVVPNKGAGGSSIADGSANFNTCLTGQLCRDKVTWVPTCWRAAYFLFGLFTYPCTGFCSLKSRPRTSSVMVSPGKLGRSAAVKSPGVGLARCPLGLCVHTQVAKMLSTHWSRLLMELLPCPQSAQQHANSCCKAPGSESGEKPTPSM
jgi:hypothetical protein